MSNEREQLIARLRRFAVVLEARGETYDAETCEQAIASLSAPVAERGQPFALYAAPPVDPEGIQLLREARQCVHKEANDEREIEGRGYQCYLADRIDAYLAKVQHEL